MVQLHRLQPAGHDLAADRDEALAAVGKADDRAAGHQPVQPQPFGHGRGRRRASPPAPARAGGPAWTTGIGWARRGAARRWSAGTSSIVLWPVPDGHSR